MNVRKNILKMLAAGIFLAQFGVAAARQAAADGTPVSTGGEASGAHGAESHPAESKNPKVHMETGWQGKSSEKTTDKPAANPAKRGKTDPLNDFDLARYQYCGKDSDCVATMNSCCDCANGGAEVAVNKDRLADFQKNFDCLHIACTEKAPAVPCLSGVVTCLEHRCKYIAEGEAANPM